MLTEIFFFALALNMFYEVVHSGLYTTCHKASFARYLWLMVKAWVFDALAITLLYYLSYNILEENSLQFLFFVASTLVFAYIWERYSLKKKKWEYAPYMPIIFGVGLTPFLQLFLTGVLALHLAN